jgi:hypothetical protein
MRFIIIYCLNCIRRDQNSTYKTGVKHTRNSMNLEFKTLKNVDLILVVTINAAIILYY